MRLLLGWAINALSLMALTGLVPAVRISGFGTALVAALVPGKLAKLKIRRDTKNLDVQVEVGKRPNAQRQKPR